MIFRTPNDEEGVAMRPNEMVGIPRVVFFKEFQDRVEGKAPHRNEPFVPSASL